jgi:hypothetical protein
MSVIAVSRAITGEFECIGEKEGEGRMRRPVRELPEDYGFNANLDLAKQKGLAIALNVVAAASVFGYGLLFLFLAITLRPSDALTTWEFQVTGVTGFLLLGARLFVITALMLLLHEGVHGVCFRLYTGEWGTFAFKGLYAYAAAPNWYLPRNQHLVTALAPYLGLSMVGILLMPIVPLVMLPDLLIFLVLNAAGATGDLAAVIWLLTKPPDAFVKDYGDGVAIYIPGEGSQAEAE